MASLSSSAVITRSITASNPDILTSSGDWSRVQNSQGDYTSLFTSRFGASAQFMFIGTSVKVIGTIPSLSEGDESPIGLYYVDGELDTTYHYIRHPETNYNYTFFQSSTLTPGQHTLLITSDVDFAWFTVDYVDITVPQELASATVTGLNLYPTRAVSSTTDYWATMTMTRGTNSVYTYPTSTSGSGSGSNGGLYPNTSFGAGRIAVNILVLVLIILGIFLVFAGIGGAVYYFIYWPSRKRRREKQWNMYASTNPGGDVPYVPVPLGMQSTPFLAHPNPNPNQPTQNYADMPVPSSPRLHPNPNPNPNMPT